MSEAASCQPEFYYCLIAFLNGHGGFDLIDEYSSYTGNFRDIAHRLVKALINGKAEDGKRSFAVDK